SVLVEDGGRLQLWRAGLAHESEERRRRQVGVDDEGEILPDLGVRTHLLELHCARSALDERVEVELERAPASLEDRRVELPQPALIGPRRLAGVQQRDGRALEGR